MAQQQQNQYDLTQDPIPQPTRQGVRFAGADLPATQTSNVPQGLTAFNDTPNTKGLSYLEQGGKYLQGAMDYEQQAAKQRLQSMQQGQEATQQAIQTSAQLATQAAQARLAGTNRHPFELLTEAVGELVKTRKAEQEKTTKAGQDKAYMQAFLEVQQLKTAWREKGLDEHGTIAYQKALQDTIAKYPGITSEQVQKLVDDGYGVALQYATEKSHKQQKTLEEIADGQRSSIVMGTQLSINNDLKELKNTVTDDPQPILDRIDEKLKTVLSTPGLDPLSAITVLNATLKSTLEGMDSRNGTYWELQKRQQALIEYAKTVEDINRKVEDGSMSTDQRTWELQLKKNELGLQGAVDTPAPFESMKIYEEHLRTEKNIRDLEQDGAITQAERVQMSDNNIGYLAWGMIQNPKTVDLIKANKVYAAIPGVQTAVKLAELYTKSEKERNQLNLEIQNTRTQIAQLDKQGVEFFIQQARTGKVNPSTKAILDSLGLGTALPEPTKEPLTPQQEQQLRASFAAVRQEMVRKQAILDEQFARSYGPLATYGLVGNKEAIGIKMQGNKSAYDAFINNFGKQTSPSVPTGRLGTTSPFSLSQSRKAAGGVNFQTTKYKGKTTILPFEPGGVAGYAQNYGQDRGDHAHAGEDIAVPSGTKIVSPVRGRVTNIGNDPSGYGYYMDVQGADGMLYRYGHLTGGAYFKRIGDNVDVGDALARSGNSGRSSGPHLHFEIRNPKSPYGFDGTVDPLNYLASRPDIKTGTYNKARTLNDKSWYLSSVATNTLEQTEKVPGNAIPLPGGYYIVNNQLRRLNKPEAQVPVEQAFSGGNPIRQSVTRGSLRNDPNDNHGYSVLAQDHDFRRKLADVSNKLGISSQWLADIMAHENQFRTGNPNGLGCVGLIQFCPKGGLDETGKSATELSNMSRAQQMEYVYRYLKKFGSSIQKGPEYLLASIWGGQGLLDKIERRGLKAVMADPRVNDCAPGDSPGNGCVSFGQYVSLLGSGAGRNYKTAQTRSNKLATVIHTSYHSNCPMCRQIKDSGSIFIPHESSLG